MSTEVNDKDREEARVFVKDIISRVFPDHIVAIKSVNVDIASEYVKKHDDRTRAEALKEAAEMIQALKSSGSALDCIIRNGAFDDVLAILAYDPQTPEQAQKAANDRAYKWRHDMMGDSYDSEQKQGTFDNPVDADEPTEKGE